MGSKEYRKDHMQGNTTMSFFARASLRFVSASSALPNPLLLVVVVAAAVEVEGVTDMIARVERNASYSRGPRSNLEKSGTEQEHSNFFASRSEVWEIFDIACITNEVHRYGRCSNVQATVLNDAVNKI